MLFTNNRSLEKKAFRGNIREKKWMDFMEKILYKILSKELWELSLEKEFLFLPSFDEPFIHFATEEQLERVCAKFWSDVPEYFILKIDAKKLVGNLIFEKNPGGTTCYYHLYEGKIPMGAVIEVNLHKKGISSNL
jgi:uncharacterized protein (DUF952 family)